MGEGVPLTENLNLTSGPPQTRKVEDDGQRTPPYGLEPSLEKVGESKGRAKKGLSGPVTRVLERDPKELSVFAL